MDIITLIQRLLATVRFGGHVHADTLRQTADMLHQHRNILSPDMYAWATAQLDRLA